MPHRARQGGNTTPLPVLIARDARDGRIDGLDLSGPSGNEDPWGVARRAEQETQAPPALSVMPTPLVKLPR